MLATGQGTIILGVWFLGLVGLALMIVGCVFGRSPDRKFANKLLLLGVALLVIAVFTGPLLHSGAAPNPN
jgi:hypothetical protein